MEAYCDTTSGGEGWLVVQRRDKQYSTSFYRAWTEYADGFGDLYKEFWFGLNAMYCLTNAGNWKLCIDFPFTTFGALGSNGMPHSSTLYSCEGALSKLYSFNVSSSKLK